jgi:hypothetical protein
MSIYKGRPNNLGPDVAIRPKADGHGVAARPNALGSGVTDKLKLGSGRLIQVSWARQGCKTQGTWVYTPVTPKQLG